MDHYKVMVKFLSQEELEKELHKALTDDNEKLAKVISDEIFERKLGGKER